LTGKEVIMKHITEQYGTPANLTECPQSDYWQISAMLAKVGVETRMTTRDGATDMVTFQIRNVYREKVQLNKGQPGSYYSCTQQ